MMGVGLLGMLVLGWIVGYSCAKRRGWGVIRRFEHYDEKAQARHQVYRQIAGEWPSRQTGTRRR
jgi:hypothetical protein